MPSINYVLALTAFALITCGTPGPNNILLTVSGARIGWRRSLPLLLAVVGGLNLLLASMILGVGALLHVFPGLYLLLKILGSLYLLWLAWGIARSGMPDGDATAPVITPGRGFLLQIFNPKGWLMALSASSNFILPQSFWISAIAIVGTFLVMGLLTGGLWARLGALVAERVRSPVAWQRFNRILAVITAGTVPLLWT